MKVVGVDVAVRPALAGWKQTFENHGQKLDEWSGPLENYAFVNCGVEDLKSVDGVDARCIIVAVHGINSQKYST
jgi:hypothetical protein